MGSSGFGARSEALASDPWFWAGIAGLFLGYAFGRAIRSLMALARGDRRKAARRSSAAILFLSVSVLGAAGFVVRCPLESLSPSLFAWSGGTGLFGLVCGLFPFAAGLPLGLAAAAAAWFFATDLAPYVPLSGPGPVARITCFAMGGDGAFSGELELEERDSVPTMQKIDARLPRLSLVVERLDLEGPMGLFAGSRLYRIAGIAEEPSGPMALAFDAGQRIMPRIAPIAAEGAAGRSAFLISRNLLYSPSLALAPLETIRFSFDTELRLIASAGYSAR